MNTTKITITLALDEKMGDDSDMMQAIGLLRDMGIVPCSKVVLSLECAPVAAEAIQDQIDAALINVPDSVDVTIKTTNERGVRRIHGSTPIEKAITGLRNAAPSAESITITAGGRSAVIKGRE